MDLCAADSSGVSTAFATAAQSLQKLFLQKSSVLGSDAKF